uniref:Uncharacterized protein n=1 Tax=Rhizophora mucronata TaxID=61149 RepID=A0A2P2QGR3_RHIMU
MSYNENIIPIQPMYPIYVSIKCHASHTHCFFTTFSSQPNWITFNRLSGRNKILNSKGQDGE